MEKLFLKRVTVSLEVWQIVILFIVAMIGLVGFGALVEHALSDGARAPRIAVAALDVARIPITARKMVKEATGQIQPHLARTQRFEGESGFARLRPGGDEALLLSRYDGDKNRAVVEILDLDSGAVLHSYAPDISSIIAASKKKAAFVDLRRDRNLKRFGMNHPYLTQDGGLIFQGMNTPLTRTDVCSNIVWTIDGFFHHSIERDADGNYWTAGYFIPPTNQNVTSDGRDDTIVKISPDGEVLLERSISKILIDNGLLRLVYGSVDPDDPVHVNDIEPVLVDGPHWQRGDLFLSFRHSDAIVLYRPATNKVIWHRQGPWFAQHDVDILNDHEIAIFNNNVVKLPWEADVLGVNDTLIYDFSTGEITSPFSEGFKINDIRTVYEGRSELLPDGELFVEEQNYGRILKMDALGNVTWRYVNRASDDGRVYLVHWSRIITAEQAERTALLASSKCPGNQAAIK